MNQLLDTAWDMAVARLEKRLVEAETSIETNEPERVLPPAPPTA